MNYDDQPITVPSVPDPWANAPTLHYSTDKPITRDDLKRAIANRDKPRRQVGWNAEQLP